jgi:hypothetical protein
VASVVAASWLHLEKMGEIQKRGKIKQSEKRKRKMSLPRGTSCYFLVAAVAARRKKGEKMKENQSLSCIASVDDWYQLLKLMIGTSF